MGFLKPILKGLSFPRLFPPTISKYVSANINGNFTFGSNEARV